MAVEGTSPLGPGRIFWASDPGERGQGKPRPMIVATRRSDIIKTQEVIVVVCSTDFVEPLRSHEVRLPSQSDGMGLSRLKKDTVAVCDWVIRLPVADAWETGGLITGGLLREIYQRAGIPYIPER